MAASVTATGLASATSNGAVGREGISFRCRLARAACEVEAVTARTGKVTVGREASARVSAAILTRAAVTGLTGSQGGAATGAAEASGRQAANGARTVKVNFIAEKGRTGRRGSISKTEEPR